MLAAGLLVDLYVLDNDSDPDGNLAAATLSVVTDPLHASRFTLEGDHFRYRSRPASSPRFGADDTFDYELCDESGLCATATVTLVIVA
jgi:hypothetical protein